MFLTYLTQKSNFENNKNSQFVKKSEKFIYRHNESLLVNADFKYSHKDNVSKSLFIHWNTSFIYFSKEIKKYTHKRTSARS